MHTKDTILEHLAGLAIACRTLTHPPLRTVEDAKAQRHDLPGGHTKNLFLKDKKGRMFLLTADEDAPVDLKALAGILGAKSLSFASAERLSTYLGVEPGAVTPLAAINDSGGDVTVALDRSLLAHALINVHPLVNTATTAMHPADLVKFLEACGHAPLIVDL